MRGEDEAMATKGATKGMKRRDRYQSRLYPDTAAPQGVGAASLDLVSTLTIIQQWIEREEWQSQRIELDGFLPNGRAMDLIEVIEIALEAWRQSINPAILIYDRLQQNAEQAVSMFLAAALAERSGEAERWGIVGGVLENTLRDKAMVPRSTLALAHRLIQEADAEDDTRASTLIQAIMEQAEAAAAALEERQEEQERQGKQHGNK